MFNTTKKENMFKPQFNMSEVVPGVFLVEIKGNNDLAHTFLRVQEFYESGNPEIQGKEFTFQQYSDWYSYQSKTGTFSYGEDWKGFNVPSDAVYQCYAINKERTEYDNFFLSLVSKIEKEVKSKGLEKFYMIGVRAGDVRTLDHEIAHGLFTVNKDYKKEMKNLVSELPKEVNFYLGAYLKDLGYAESVHEDEIQAYLSTGLRDNMDKEMLEQYMSEFIDVFQKHKEDALDLTST